MLDTINSPNVKHRFTLNLFLAVSVCVMVMLAGCGGTKVYNSSKTVVYNGATYNLGNVRQIQPKISGKLSDSNTVDLRNADRKQIESYLEEYNSIYVRMAFAFDEQEMLYRASSIDRWSDYSKMKKSFDNASKQINRLMADKKKLQLKLK